MCLCCQCSISVHRPNVRNMNTHRCGWLLAQIYFPSNSWEVLHFSVFQFSVLFFWSANSHQRFQRYSWQKKSSKKNTSIKHQTDSNKLDHLTATPTPALRIVETKTDVKGEWILDLKLTRNMNLSLPVSLKRRLMSQCCVCSLFEACPQPWVYKKKNQLMQILSDFWTSMSRFVILKAMCVGSQC